MNLLAALQELLSPDQVTANATVREHHSHDESYHTPQLPDVVAFPESTDDVRKILAFAHEHQIPVVPFAVGSSLEGHVIPVHGGISLDMTRMNRILDIRPDDFLAHVQAGVTKLQLNDALKRLGLFFTVDPGADASLGGMAATNASGTTTVRYGVMRDQVRSMEIVLPGGDVIQTGSLAAKSSSGYHLNGLFVGSEGTLGVITELWVRVHGLPENVITAIVTFPDIDGCVRTSTAIMGAGIPVARLELMDERMIRAINRYKGTDYANIPTLLVEFHGNPEGLRQDVRTAQEIATDEGCASFAFETTEEGKRKLWDARHIAALAYIAQFPEKEMMSTDVCVPLSELAASVKEARRIMDEAGFMGSVLGHVGDGNFHALLPVDPHNEQELAAAYDVNERLVHHAIKLGGTCTGEHGVGIGKRKYQRLEHGRALDLMLAIKKLIDPRDIMNPGKLVSDLD